MNYEQKYKEALERAKAEQEAFLKIGNISAKAAIERIFPELRESEDEKNRKRLIECLKFSLKGAEEQDEAGCNRQKDIEAFKWGISQLEKQQGIKIIQWTGDNLKEVVEFTGISPEFNNWFKSWDEFESYVHSHNDIFKLFFQDGSHYEVPKGAWIVRTPDGYNVASKSKFVEKQKPVEWSEEDEKKLQDVIYWFEIFCEKNQTKPEMKESLDWLKSLKPNHWKPSEEQMKAIKFCCANFEEYDALKSLYNDLKTLI